MNSIHCCAKMLKTASLFQNINHLIVSADNARQLEQQAADSIAANRLCKKEMSNHALALGQLFFRNFSAWQETDLPLRNGQIFSPDWIEPPKNGIMSGDCPQARQIERGFYNLFGKIVEHLEETGLDPDAAAGLAKIETRYHYQWMVMNLTLPSIVDENLQTDILNSKAPLYSEFYRQNIPLDNDGRAYPEEFIFLAVPVATFLCRCALDQNPSFTALLDDLNQRSFPSAQAAIQDVFKRTGILLDPPDIFMNTAQMPIWAFLIDEIRQQDGQYTIGSLGSYILSDTIIGMLMSDPATYWHQTGSDAGRWSPDDGSLSKPIDTLDRLLAV